METKTKSEVQSVLSQAITVFITTASEDEASAIGRAVVSQRLAACTNILALKKSIFEWEGKICEESEFLMIVKSRLDLFQELSVVVKGLHSYKVPEIVAMPIIAGSRDYLDWIMDNTRK